jgi:hypothetical protein
VERRNVEVLSRVIFPEGVASCRAFFGMFRQLGCCRSSSTTSPHAPETAGHSRTGQSIRDEEISQEHFVELDSRLANLKLRMREERIRSEAWPCNSRRARGSTVSGRYLQGRSVGRLFVCTLLRPKGQRRGLPIAAPDGFYDRKRPSGACAPKNREGQVVEIQPLLQRDVSPGWAV